ncbi:complement factor H-like [Trichomycterus rosablanca]|uniref:complement factor H-like n=1 Tax=Trichomycterus rosablanca TaxID=2290929 RepID=UPI002F35AFBB
MHVAVEFLILTLWVFPFTLAQNQEKNCGHPGDTPDGNFRLIRGTEFVFGATVEYTCNIGFEMASSVSHRNCHTEGWDNAVPLCKKKNCGHPGDTPDGNFRLIQGTEFVFGATVEYTCNIGYVMASSVSHRNCRTEGWDNVVPLCKGKKIVICFHPCFDNLTIICYNTSYI